MRGVYVLVLAFAATEILTLDVSTAVMLSTVSNEVAMTANALGNFLHARTHLALISAAYQFDRSPDKIHVRET
jgi:hypothetical protein